MSNKEKDKKKERGGGNGKSLGKSSELVPNVTAREQAQYDRFVTNGLKVIEESKTRRLLLRRLALGDPVDALANALVMVVIRLEDSAHAKGRRIPGDVKFHGGVELLECLLELGEQAGVFSMTEMQGEAALYRAMDLYYGKLASQTEAGGLLPLPHAPQR